MLQAGDEIFSDVQRMYSSLALAQLISSEHTLHIHCRMIHEQLTESANRYGCL